MQSLLQGPEAACITSVKSIPPECQPYILLTAIMGVLFIAAMIRCWLLRRVEDKLLKNRDALEKQIMDQQKDHMATRQDANAWRAEMQRQFDHYRHMASDQLKVEEKRFDDLLQKSRDREHHLQTSLDIAKQMCSELPGTKARLMQLESVIGIDGGEALTPAAVPTPTEPARMIGLLPDLNTETSAQSVLVPTDLPEIPPAAVEINQETQSQFQQLQQQNNQLQQALTAARLRSRIRERTPQRGRNGKH